jgi:hypothetical protein
MVTLVLRYNQGKSKHLRIYQRPTISVGLTAGWAAPVPRGKKPHQWWRYLGFAAQDGSKWEAKIWNTQEPGDPIANRLNQSVLGIESICRAVLQKAGE